jgi:hypothetical protein
MIDKDMVALRALHWAQILAVRLRDQSLPVASEFMQLADGTICMYQSEGAIFGYYLRVEIDEPSNEEIVKLIIRNMFLTTAEHVALEHVAKYSVFEFVEVIKWWNQQYIFHRHPKAAISLLRDSFPALIPYIEAIGNGDKPSPREVAIRDFKKAHNHDVRKMSKELARLMRQEADKIEKGQWSIIHDLSLPNENNIYDNGIRVLVSKPLGCLVTYLNNENMKLLPSFITATEALAFSSKYEGAYGYEEGRQQTGYEKLALVDDAFSSSLRAKCISALSAATGHDISNHAYDCYVLRYKAGTYNPLHKDDAPFGASHWRINVLLQAPLLGGKLWVDGAYVPMEPGDALAFRPDLLAHAVDYINSGTRLLLTVGVLL